MYLCTALPLLHHSIWGNAKRIHTFILFFFIHFHVKQPYNHSLESRLYKVYGIRVERVKRQNCCAYNVYYIQKHSSILHFP